jgi:flagellar P-ring protein precursor FlgI
MKSFAKVLWMLSLLLPVSANAERVKDLASMLGVRDNQLLGYGLIVGLDGTGDQSSPFTLKSTMNMLTQLGVNLPPGTNLEMKNLAAVLVTASLPAFARPGQTIDITISSVGNAKSLRGGTLVMTPLKGADGQVYAMGQGNIVVSEPGAAPGGGRGQPNHLIVGRIPSGATVERSVPTSMGQGDYVLLTLNTADFTTASRMTNAINKEFATAPDIAAALDGRAIRVRAPHGPARVAFMSRLENIQVEPAHAAARVIINARTGSIVMNQNVTLEVCSISHGNMTVVVKGDADSDKSQAEAAAKPGEAKIVVADSKTAAAETKTTSGDKVSPGNLLLLPRAVSLNEVIRALNAIGATPKDLLAILQAMKSSGALHAELEII